MNALSIITSLQKKAWILYGTALLATALILGTQQYQSLSNSRITGTADAYFELISRNEPTLEQLETFIDKHPHGIYKDLATLEVAAIHAELSDDKSSIEALKSVVENSKIENIRSLAAYRVANQTKRTDTEIALNYINKVTIKSMKHTRSLLATELYRIRGEYEKALLEVNSLLSDINQEMPDSKILIELATQEKRQLANGNSGKT